MTPSPYLPLKWCFFLGVLLLISSMVAWAGERAWPRAVPANMLAGYYVAGAEKSSFTPCGGGGLPGYGYWLKSAPDSGFFTALQAMLPPAPVGDWVYETPSMYVRFIGKLSPERDPLGNNGYGGGYGHAGYYSREVRVTKLVAIYSVGQQMFFFTLVSGLVFASAYCFTRWIYPRGDAMRNYLQAGGRAIPIFIAVFISAFVLIQRILPAYSCL